MSAPCQKLDWVKDDTDYVLRAIREWNLRQMAHTKPVKTFGELPVKDQSWVLIRAAELKDS